MSRIVVFCALGLSLLVVAPASSQLRRREPKQEAVAETRLLMEGLNQANYRGLERLLQEKPADVEAWTFARGQALLIAETGNLLMLRPPRRGQDAWMDHAVELREAASTLARAAARRDYERSRNAFRDLASTCNRCHQEFRVNVRLDPFADAKSSR
jgi:hypothetical protein